MDDEDGLGTTPPTRDKSLDVSPLTVARDNLALVVPIVGAFIFAIRCVIVSEGDRYVASVLIAQTSIGDAIRALLITAVALCLYGLWFAAAFMAARRIIPHGWRGPRIWDLRLRDLKGRDQRTLGLMAVSLTALLGFSYLSGFAESELLRTERSGSLPPALLVISWAGFQFVVLIMVHGYESRGYGGIGRGLAIALFLSVVALILWILVGILGSKTFWLPRERLAFQNEVPFTGYVLKVNEDYLVILKDRPRVIIERKKDTLDDRDFCHPRPTDEEEEVSGKVQSSTPVCP